MIHHPKPPGCLVKSLCLDPLHLSVTEAASALKVSRPTLSKLLNGRASISSDMAIRLSMVFDTSPQLWINLQAHYDLWTASQKKNKLRLKSLVTVAKAA